MVWGSRMKILGLIMGCSPQNAISRQLLRSLSSLQSRSPAGAPSNKLASKLFAAARGTQLLFVRPLAMNAVQPARLRQLESEANLRPRDGKKQAEYIKALGMVDPEAAVRRVESMKYASGDAVLVEYAKAIVISRQGKADVKKAEDEKREQHHQEDEEAEAMRHGATAQNVAGAGAAGVGLALPGGRGKTDPVVVTIAESTFRHQVERAL